MHRGYIAIQKDMGDLMNGCTGRTIKQTIKIILILAFYRFYHQLSMDRVF